jgi:hypothetical protein
LSGRYEETRLAVHDGVDDTSDARGDDRLAGGHRLDDGVGKCLAQRAENGDVEEMMKIRLVRPDAREMHDVREPELSCASLQ